MRLAVVASHPVQYYAPLFRALAKRLDLTVFYCHNATVKDQAQAGFGVGFTWDVDLLNGYRHVFLKNIARRPGLERFSGVDTPELTQQLSQVPFDALLLMGWHLKSYIQGLIAAKRLGIPVMVRGDSHLDTPRGMLKVAAKRVFYPHFLRRFDAALVVGARNRAYWTHYEYPPERILEAPHCVDNAFFATRSTREAGTEKRRSLGIPATAKVVLTAGKLIPIKRQLDLVEAVSQIRCSGLETHLVIAGSGPLEEQLRKLSQNRNITTHFLGFCNQSEMPAIYASADTLALCSESETWGLVVNEALACGTPALVSDACGCAPDIHRLLGPDAVFRTGDISDLTTKLRNMLTSPIGKSVIAAASTYFDPDRTADRIADATLSVRRSLRNSQ